MAHERVERWIRAAVRFAGLLGRPCRSRGRGGRRRLRGRGSAAVDRRECVRAGGQRHPRMGGTTTGDRSRRGRGDRRASRNPRQGRARRVSRRRRGGAARVSPRGERSQAGQRIAGPALRGCPLRGLPGQCHRHRRAPGRRRRAVRRRHRSSGRRSDRPLDTHQHQSRHRPAAGAPCASRDPRKRGRTPFPAWCGEKGGRALFGQFPVERRERRGGKGVRPLFGRSPRRRPARPRRHHDRRCARRVRGDSVCGAGWTRTRGLTRRR